LSVRRRSEARAQCRRTSRQRIAERRSVFVPRYKELLSRKLAHSRRFFRSPIFLHRAPAVSSKPRLKNQTSICPVRHSSPFALYRAKRFRATPSAASASQYDVPESIYVDRYRLRHVLPLLARALVLQRASHDEQKNRHAFACRSRATDRLPSGH